MQDTHDRVNEWLSEIEDGQVVRDMEVVGKREMKERLNEVYIEFQKYCEVVYLDSARERVNLTNLRWDKIIGKLGGRVL